MIQLGNNSQNLNENKAENFCAFEKDYCDILEKNA